MATQDLGQSYREVALRLGMSTGGVFNLVARTNLDPEVRAMLGELRRRWQHDQAEEARSDAEPLSWKVA